MPESFAALSHRAQVTRLRVMAANALAQYDLGGAPVFRLQLHLANTTFRVVGPDGAQYVLRVSQPDYRTDAAIRSEAQWLAALRRDTDLGVPEPVLNRSGAFLTHASAPGVPEARQCTLFRWLEGRFVRRGLGPSHLWRVGGFTARLHDHTQGWTLPAGFERPRFDTLPWVAAWLEEGTVDPDGTHIAPADRATLNEGASRITAEIEALGTTPDRFGLIHTDLHQNNYLFHNGSVRAIDFDDSGFEHYVYDLAITLWGIDTRPDRMALREALLAGYGAVRPLPPGADSHLDTFITGRNLIVCKYVLWRAADNENIRRILPYYVHRTLESVRAYLAS